MTKKNLPLAVLTLSSILITALTASTISINFALRDGPIENLDPSIQAGIDPQKNWNNVIGPEGNNISLMDATGRATPTKLSWKSDANWRDVEAYSGASKQIGDAILRHSYLDDPLTGEGNISITNIPYSTYTVILYLSSDKEGGKYGLYSINGHKHTASGVKSRYNKSPHWNQTNSITVSNLSGDLQIKNPARYGDIRASIAGLQVIGSGPTIETAELTSKKPVDPPPTLISIGGLQLSLTKKN